MTPADASPTAPPVRAVRAAPSVGVIYNPRSHRNKGQDLNLGVQANIFVAQPEDTARRSADANDANGLRFGTRTRYPRSSPARQRRAQAPQNQP